jgi:hypothetical protein
MDSPSLLLWPSARQTRLWLTHGPQEKLRAVLPPLTHLRHGRAVTTVLEGLALWMDSPLRVVLCANATAVSYWLGLTDARGVGTRGLSYDVQLVAPRDKHLAAEVHGLGDFEDMHALREVASTGGLP